MRYLGILEGDWDRNGSSVRPLFDMIKCDDDHEFSFRYRRVTDKESFRKGLTLFCNKVNFLYIAAHGTNRHLKIGRFRVSAETFCEMLSAINKASVKGVFIDGCRFMTEAAARKILSCSKNNGSNLKWVCGYSEGPKWYPSALLEGLFFYHHYWIRRGGEKNERKLAKRTAHLLAKQHGGLVSDSGLRLFVEERSGKLCDLFASLES